MGEAIKILICQGTGGISAGAKKVEAEFRRVLLSAKPDAKLPF